jgi:uroporphyrinogen-III decarboxylase
LAASSTKKIGVSGSLVSIFNAESKFGSVADYQRYTRPYDKRVFDALADTKLSFYTCTISRGHTLISSKISMRLSFNTP